MNRFLPDTWLEALMRPFAMGAPNANVYVEIPAPDMRFAIAVLLALAMVSMWRRLPERRRAVVALFAFTALAFVPWLVTSGNGRYFVPVLLLVGPLIGGLVHSLPGTRSFRIALMTGILAIQATVLMISPPWGAWAWLDWDKPPYFEVAAQAGQNERGTEAEGPTTYITLTSISYSLIAPQFPPNSRWISVASGGATPRDKEWTRQFIATAARRILVVPSVSDQTPQGQPTQKVVDALNALLGPHGLALRSPAKCDIRPSKGLVAIAKRSGAASASPDSLRFSFWLCPLTYPVAYQQPPRDPSVGATAESVFDKLEHMCPRFFRAGEADTLRIPGGALRQYGGSDMKVYVMENGEVYYKFWRALNPVFVGRAGDVLQGRATVHCEHIRGRSGLPWDREI